MLAIVYLFSEECFSFLNFICRNMLLSCIIVATKLTMRYGRKEVMSDDMERLRWKKKEGEVGMIMRIMKNQINTVHAAVDRYTSILIN